jgi:hypothetical protein
MPVPYTDGDMPMPMPMPAPYPEGEVTIPAPPPNCAVAKLVDPGMPIGVVAIPEESMVEFGAGEYWRGKDEVTDGACRERRSLKVELVEGAGTAGGGCVIDLCGGCATGTGDDMTIGASEAAGAGIVAERAGVSFNRASEADRDGPRRLAATADGLGLNLLNSYLSEYSLVSEDEDIMVLVDSPRMNFSSSLSRSDSIIFVGGGCLFSSG